MVGHSLRGGELPGEEANHTLAHVDLFEFAAVVDGQARGHHVGRDEDVAQVSAHHLDLPVAASLGALLGAEKLLTEDGLAVLLAASDFAPHARREQLFEVLDGRCEKVQQVYAGVVILAETPFVCFRSLQLLV